MIPRVIDSIPNPLSSAHLLSVSVKVDKAIEQRWLEWEPSLRASALRYSNSPEFAEGYLVHLKSVHRNRALFALSVGITSRVHLLKCLRLTEVDDPRRDESYFRSLVAKILEKKKGRRVNSAYKSCLHQEK